MIKNGIQNSQTETPFPDLLLMMSFSYFSIIMQKSSDKVLSNDASKVLKRCLFLHI